MILAQINSKPVHGQGLIQPGENHWIGVFIVPRDLFDTAPEMWEGKEIEFEGPFSNRTERCRGRGRGRIIHVRIESENNRIVINVEGLDEPELAQCIEQQPKFQYNGNLPSEFPGKDSEKKR